MLKYSQNKEKLVSYINEHSLFFENVDEDTFNAMVALLKPEHIKENIPDSKKGK